MRNIKATTLALLVPLVAIIVFSVLQRKPNAPSVEAEQAIPSPRKNVVVNSDFSERKAISDERKAEYLEAKRGRLIAAQKLAQESSPESIRQNVTAGLKSREPRYRSLMDSLNISHADASRVLEVVLERNIDCITISINTNTEGDYLKKQFLRSGQGPVKERARQEMVKIVGDANVNEIERLESQIRDEIVKSGPSLPSMLAD